MRPADPAVLCPEHGPPARPTHRFCEACGRDLRTGAQPRSVPTPTRPAEATVPTRPWLSSRVGGTSCTGCGAPVGPEGFCARCGRRRFVGRDRAELDNWGIAAVTDRARRRRNEDAVAIGRAGLATVAVVCDGVSSSSRADAASHAAVEAGIAAVLSVVATAGPDRATSAGAVAAAAAVRPLAAPTDRQGPPSCTYVSAVVTDEEVVVGWIGDSRAYWVGVDGEAACLTVDDSALGLLAAGREVPADARAEPQALIRWLGADSDDEQPQVVTVRPTCPGLVLVCSDGLSHYLPEPPALAAAVSGPLDPPIVVARRLTRLAIDAGGHDNVAVAVLPFPATRP
jgi:serine/threonine protein phosphatase PrpC